MQSTSVPCHDLGHDSTIVHAIAQARNILRNGIRKIWDTIFYAKVLYSNRAGGQSDPSGRPYGV